MPRRSAARARSRSPRKSAPAGIRQGSRVAFASKNGKVELRVAASRTGHRGIEIRHARCTRPAVCPPTSTPQACSRPSVAASADAGTGYPRAGALLRARRWLRARTREVARAVVERGTQLFVAKTVVLELEWVLRGVYGHPPRMWAGSSNTCCRSGPPRSRRSCGGRVGIGQSAQGAGLCRRAAPCVEPQLRSAADLRCQGLRRQGTAARDHAAGALASLARHGCGNAAPLRQQARAAVSFDDQVRAQQQALRQAHADDLRGALVDRRWNRVGRSTGISAGRAPFKMRST